MNPLPGHQRDTISIKLEDHQLLLSSSVPLQHGMQTSAAHMQWHVLQSKCRLDNAVATALLDDCLEHIHKHNSQQAVDE
jgi:hypothetical protein